jgi:hypothetical protein
VKASLVPDDAFALYVALGPEGRSYDAVAKHYGLTKKTITRAAVRERWQERLEALERKAQEETDAKLASTIHEANMRHRKLLLAVAARAAQALQQYELKSAMEAVRAAEVAVKLERLMLGESTESKSISVEQTSRDELARLLVAEDEVESWDQAKGEGDSDEDDPEQGADLQVCAL